MYTGNESGVQRKHYGGVDVKTSALLVPGQMSLNAVVNTISPTKSPHVNYFNDSMKKAATQNDRVREAVNKSI